MFQAHVQLFSQHQGLGDVWGYDFWDVLFSESSTTILRDSTLPFLERNFITLQETVRSAASRFPAPESFNVVFANIAIASHNLWSGRLEISAFTRDTVDAMLWGVVWICIVPQKHLQTTNHYINHFSCKNIQEVSTKSGMIFSRVVNASSYRN